VVAQVRPSSPARTGRRRFPPTRVQTPAVRDHAAFTEIPVNFYRRAQQKNVRGQFTRTGIRYQKCTRECHLSRVAGSTV